MVFLVGARFCALKSSRLARIHSIEFGACLVGAVEARQHIAREELVGALGRLPIGPIMRQHQDAAEAAGLVPEFLQHRDRVIGRADRAAAIGDDAFEAAEADRLTAQRADRIGVVLPFVETPAHILHRLLARLGDVERRHQPPIAALDRLAVLGRVIGGDLPIQIERVVAHAVRDRDAEHAEAEAAGDLAAVRRDRAGDREMRPRLRIGAQAAAAPLSSCTSRWSW